MRSATITVRKWVLRAAFTLAKLAPVRERIVLASGNPAPLSGNLAFIRDELVRRGLEVKTVVLTAPHPDDPIGTVAHAQADIRAERYLATSRVFIVDDYFFPLYVATPRPETTVIQTWHASGAFKKIGYSLLGKGFGADEALVRAVRIHSNYDRILMGSKTSVPAYSEAFRQPAEKFVTGLGIPRTDLFFDTERTTRTATKIRRDYGLPADKKVVLYAPTFRGASKNVAAYHDDLDLEVLRAALSEDYVLLLRLHPSVDARTALPPDLAGFVIDVSAHPDINELMLVSDVLVTDYSSAIFEFSLLGRPMVFFAPDRAAYEAERGFYFDYETGVPGPVFTTSQEVADYLAAGVFDIERVSVFKAASFEIADGRASARFVDELVLPALGERTTTARVEGMDPA